MATRKQKTADLIGELRVEQWPIDRLVGYPGNPRKNDHVVDRMCEAIKEFGFRIPIVAKSDGLIVDGHLRLKSAMKLGLKSVPVAIADDLTDQQIKAFRLLANASASWAEWDNQLLRIELEDLQLSNFPMHLTGFDDMQLVQFMAGVPAGKNPEGAPEPPAVPVSRRGDIWVLGGKHRIMCGSALERKDVDALLDGSLPDLANCDPPYGVSIVKGAADGGSKPFGSGRGHGLGKAGFGRVHGNAAKAIIETGVYAPVIGDDSTETAIASYRMLCDLGIKAMVLWGGNYYANALPPSRCWFVWDKEVTGSFADVEMAWTNCDQVARLFRHEWNGLMKASERGERRIHPTQKPVALSQWAIETAAPESKSTLDLFLGSASSLIAAEIKAIRHFGMELAETYVDAAVLRWQQFTGKEARHAASGLTYEEERTARIKPTRKRKRERSAA